MTGTLCTAAWANVAQCYLVKGFDRNVFGKYPKLDWLANSNVLTGTSCTKPLVLKPCIKMFRRNIKGFMHHCVQALTKPAGACFVHGRHFGFASRPSICNFPTSFLDLMTLYRSGSVLLYGIFWLWHRNRPSAYTKNTNIK